MDGDDGTTFVCPECRGEMAVAARTRSALVETGCVFCGATVPARAFAGV